MKKRIFLIDDEPDFSSMLKLSLESMDYFNVGEENDPRCAIASARLFDPDLIMLDIMMPNIDGSELASSIRSDPVLKDVPVIFLTALVSNTDAPAGACQSGGQTYLPKHLPVDQLIDRIKEKLAPPVNDGAGLVNDSEAQPEVAI